MLLTLGVMMFAGVHMFGLVATGTRQALIARLGHGPYKGLFALDNVIAIVLIVIGWRAMGAELLWTPPAALHTVTLLLMPLAIILFISSNAPTDIKRVLRHPQLTGVKLWAVAHLLSNGETRSVILFGGLLAWAVLEVIFINRRDGAWQKPPPQGALKTGISLMIGLAVTAALIWAHPWFTGRAVF